MDPHRRLRQKRVRCLQRGVDRLMFRKRCAPALAAVEPDAEMARNRAMALVEEIADLSHVDELDIIAWKNIPSEALDYFGQPSDAGHALELDPRLIESLVWAKCVPAADAGIDPYPG